MIRCLPNLLRSISVQARPTCGALLQTDPYKAVAVDVALLKAIPNLPGGFMVTGLVYDVKTGRVATVVPAAKLRSGLI